MKRLGFNLALLGMIASGKETQANILKKKFALKFVETGVFSRKLLKAKGKEGDIARKSTGKGDPLHTKLIQQFLKNEINKKPKNKDLLILGGRLKPEAQLIKKLLDQKGEKLFALFLSLPDKEVYQRSHLRSQSNAKEIYKVLDDKKIIARRIKYHKEQVSKTVKYYQKFGILKKINGNQPIQKVTRDILKALSEFKIAAAS